MDAKAALAEPTSARTAVGFSGELTHPPCANAGDAKQTNNAKPVSRKSVFFISHPLESNKSLNSQSILRAIGGHVFYGICPSFPFADAAAMG